MVILILGNQWPISHMDRSVTVREPFWKWVGDQETSSWRARWLRQLSSKNHGEQPNPCDFMLFSVQLEKWERGSKRPIKGSPFMTQLLHMVWLANTLFAVHHFQRTLCTFSIIVVGIQRTEELCFESRQSTDHQFPFLPSNYQSRLRSPRWVRTHKFIGNWLINGNYWFEYVLAFKACWYR